MNQTYKNFIYLSIIFSIVCFLNLFFLYHSINSIYIEWDDYVSIVEATELNNPVLKEANLKIHDSIREVKKTLLFAVILSLTVFLGMLYLAARKTTAMNLKMSKNLLEQEIVNKLLRIPVSTNVPLKEILEEAFYTIISTQWLAVQSKGGIFLVENDQLKLVVSMGMGEKIEKMCSVVEKGRCLCGRAFVEQKTIHASCVDHRHENRFEGMSEHGHYSVPIKRDNKVLGVMVLYLEHGHQRQVSEVKYLEACADVIGGITSIYLNELDLVQARDNAQRAEKAKADFLANMSHEIRTPMNAVLSCTNLLMDSEHTPENTKLLNTIQNSGGILLTLINDILDFSKIESGKMQLENEAFDLKEAIYEVVDLFKTNASKKGITLEASFDEQVPLWVKGDVTRVRQIIVNLIGNAIKFTKDVVRVEAKYIGEKNEKSMVQISVTDNGIGMSKEAQGKLFKSFSQVDASTTRKYGGTGLGLAICKGLSEAMGGEISVESEEGEGSQFSIEIPFEPTAALAERSQNRGFQIDKDLGQKHPLRILMAEDNSVNQMVAKKILGKLGYRIDVVSNGLEAVEAVSRFNYDVILMDQHMPEMNGVDATKEIRKSHPSVPKIFALTASVFKEDRDRCMNAGMNGFLNKPIDVQQLAEALLSCEASTSAGESELKGDEGHSLQSLSAGTESESFLMSESTSAELEPPPISGLSPSGLEVAQRESELVNREEGRSLVDVDQLIENFGGEVEILIEIVIESLQCIPGYLEQINQALHDKDAKKLEVSAHTLKGTLANYFVEELVQMAFDLENRGRSSQFAGASEKFNLLKEAMVPFIEELENLVKQRESA